MKKCLFFISLLAFAINTNAQTKFGAKAGLNVSNLSGDNQNADAKVGLLRLGELMAGQFDRYGNNTTYWTLTPYSASIVRDVSNAGTANNNSPSNAYGVRPSVNLKSNVQITSGTGTEIDPFTLALESTS